MQRIQSMCVYALVRIDSTIFMEALFSRTHTHRQSYTHIDCLYNCVCTHWHALIVYTLIVCIDAHWCYTSDDTHTHTHTNTSEVHHHRWLPMHHRWVLILRVKCGVRLDAQSHINTRAPTHTRMHSNTHTHTHTYRHIRTHTWVLILCVCDMTHLWHTHVCVWHTHAFNVSTTGAVTRLTHARAGVHT